MTDLVFLDSTLRDGSHAIRHQFTEQTISDFCHEINSVGLHSVILGHGMGLGANSIHVGFSLVDELKMFQIAKSHLTNTKMGAFCISGFGTIENHIKPVIKEGGELFCIASHCTEANITKKHIEFIASQNLEVYGILMMYHMASTEALVQEALKMQSYGATGVIIMDSAGTSTPALVQQTITPLVNALNIPIGFHAHNNLGLAVSNSYIALKAGAKIIDTTIRGMGAGAGNCQLEALIAFLKMESINTNIDLFKLFDISENIIKPLYNKGVDAISIMSGMSGVFSGFLPYVLKASKAFEVSPYEIFIELGNNKIVGGQEDMIIQIAQEIRDKQENKTRIQEIESLL
ncbi:MAG: 4-hydroxy-2-oxovalerate aldolase [Brevinema sp.]